MIFIWVIRLAFGALVAFTRTAVGKGSLQENLTLQIHGMGAFEIRVQRKPAGGTVPFEVIEVEGRGLIPVTSSQPVAFVTSVVDVTDPDNKRPVISSIEDFQEPRTIAYQHRINPSVVNPGQGFADWVRVGVVLPGILVPPEKGRRRLFIVVRAVAADKEVPIEEGFGGGDSNAFIGTYVKEVSQDFTVPGYEEIADERALAKSLSVRLAVAVAMADGAMDESEAEAIAEWINKQLSLGSNHAREGMKKECSLTFKQSYRDALAGRLSWPEVAAELSEVHEESLKYQAVELCLDVMAADGVAEASELKVIRQIAERLGLDYDELQRMKDLRMVGLESSALDGMGPEEVLGIDRDWPKERIRKHLRTEFAKWNARLNNLSDPSERANAQSMLDLIAELRKKYA